MPGRMAPPKPKTIVTYRMRGEAETATRTLIATRDLIDVCDEPVERGGSNEGLAPTEFLMAALLGCTNVISHKIAQAMGLTIAAMELTLVGRLDTRGVNLIDEVDVPFPDMKLTVTLTTDASSADVEALKTDLHKYCAISKIIQASGTKLIEEWIVRPINA